MTMKVVESGITVSVPENHANQKTNKIFFNPKMRGCRELALTALCTLDKQWQKPGALKCLDAFAGTGVAGLQWKKALGSKVEVTINDVDEDAMKSIKANCAANSFKEGVSSLSHPTQGMLLPQDKPSGDRMAVGDRLEFADRNSSASMNLVEITHDDADVVLHQQQFNFIYIDAPGSPVLHLASAFRHAFHGAVVVLVVSDVTALYGKAPEVLRRNHGADAARTDYTREMAARILLATAAQSAARYNKGLHVLYTAADAHFISVAVQVKRGAKHANTSVNRIAPTLHCLLCQEWEVVNRCSNPHENVYKLLPCSCYSDNPGKTAIQLGPMWTGPIFDRDYLGHMENFVKDFKFSQSTQNLFAVLLEESECPLYLQCRDAVLQPRKSNCGLKRIEKHSHDSIAVPESENPYRSSEVDNANNDKNQAESTKSYQDLGQSSVLKESLSDSGNVDQSSKKMMEEISDISSKKSVSEVPAEKETGSKKRPCEDSDGSERKKAKINSKVKMDISLSNGYRNCTTTEVPMFYYNLQKRKLRNIDIPKIGKVVSLLHCENYRASRTHFDPMAVRTDASHSQVKAVLTKHCAQNATQ